MNLLGVALGGAFGALSRFGLTFLANRLAATTALAGLPVGTLLVNVLGSFGLGAFLGLGAAQALPMPLRLAVATGFLGSLTTFSTFEADAAHLLGEGRMGWAAAYVLANLLLGFLAFLAGAALARLGRGGAA